MAKKSKNDANIIKELKKLSNEAYKAIPSSFPKAMKPNKLKDDDVTYDEIEINGVKEDRVTNLYLVRTRLNEIPECIWQLDALEFLKCEDAFSKNISNPILPSSVTNLTRLRTITLRNASFINFPVTFQNFSKLESLTRLNISDNSLNQIPIELGELKNLEWLNLKSNGLTDFPDFFVSMTKLKELKLGDNNFDDKIIDKINNLLPSVEIDWSNTTI